MEKLDVKDTDGALELLYLYDPVAAGKLLKPLLEAFEDAKKVHENKGAILSAKTDGDGRMVNGVNYGGDDEWAVVEEGELEDGKEAKAKVE